MAAPWQIEWHDELDSTNRVAVARVLELWAQEKSADGFVIAARRQTAGRGQHGRIWASPAGGLYMSAVVETVPSQVRDRLALVAGVAVTEALVPGAGSSPQIRWPNDVLLNGKKVAGILCEAVSQGQRWATVIGIGININTQRADLPRELQNSSTSLREWDGKSRNIEAFALLVLACLHDQLSLVRSQGLAPIIARVRCFDALGGQPVRLLHRGTVVEGIGAGISYEGALNLQMTNGTIQSFADGSISAASDPAIYAPPSSPTDCA